MSCEFCEQKQKIDTEYGVLSISKITPLPELDLTTGEYAPEVDPPFFSLFYNAGDEGIEEVVPIKYCPMCGKELIASYDEKEQKIIAALVTGNEYIPERN